MNKLYLLQINYFLYFALHRLLRKAYAIKDEEERNYFLSGLVIPIEEAYSLVDSFLKKYDGDSEFIDVDYSRQAYTQLSKSIFEHFPSYKKYIDSVDDSEQIELSQSFVPISELRTTLQRKQCSDNQ